ncbi:MAG: ORF6N domain-containing protein [Ruminococcus sp.]|nr:ORF6N domain-containing protein [Ruminococcus sp.]
MYKLLVNPIEQKGQRVLTTVQLAEAYGTDVKVISKNFTRNKDRYIEGIHFYRLTGEELKKFKTIRQFDESSLRVNVLYLWTEKGALLHAKSLNTDKAWEVYDFLVDTYFRARQIEAYYNDMLVKIMEKLDKIERKQEKFEKYVKRRFNLIHRQNKNIRELFSETLSENNQAMFPAFIYIRQEITDRHNEIVRIVKNILSDYKE